MRKNSVALWALLCLLLSTVTIAQDPRLADVDAFVASVMQAGSVPGVALVIVEGDQVLMAKGFGSRRRGEASPVDAHTLFGIASLTKAFTTAALGILVDRGTVRLDEPIAEALPGFQLADPDVRSHATVRDALAHRTGAAAEDLLWYTNPHASAAALISAMAALPQEAPLREQFIYNNLMYVVAGAIILEKTGKSWEDFVSSELLAPIGMRDTSVRLDDLSHRRNIATPYIRAGPDLLEVPHYAYQNTAPSGGMYSSASDMGRWMRFILNGGAIDGERILSADFVSQAAQPQMIVGHDRQVDDLVFPNANLVAYGLGWFVSDYAGRTVLSHAGGVDGMASFIALIPEQNFGIAILENVESDMARMAIRNFIFDSILLRTNQGWEKRYAEWLTKSSPSVEEPAHAPEARLQSDRGPAKALSQYEGTYANLLLGNATVRSTKDGALTCTLGTLPAMRLTLRDPDRFQLTWPDMNLNVQGTTLVTFKFGTEMKASSFQITGPMLERETVYNAQAD